MIDYVALKIITNDCEEAFDKDISHEVLAMQCNVRLSTQPSVPFNRVGIGTMYGWPYTIWESVMLFVVYSAARLLRFNWRRANVACCEVCLSFFSGQGILFVKLTAVRTGVPQTFTVSPSWSFMFLLLRFKLLIHIAEISPQKDWVGYIYQSWLLS